jgi:hypothetical protein
VNLRSVRPGDIIRAGNGPGQLHAIVLDKERGRLHVRHLFPHDSKTVRWLRASDVTAHWSRRA